MKVKKLVWEGVEGHFGKSWMAEIPGFEVAYFIYIDRNSGKTMGINLDRTKKEFSSIDEAKEHFQDDFNKKVKELIA